LFSRSPLPTSTTSWTNKSAIARQFRPMGSTGAVGGAGPQSSRQTGPSELRTSRSHRRQRSSAIS
jgi:hypothetical protein